MLTRNAFVRSPRAPRKKVECSACLAGPVTNGKGSRPSSNLPTECTSYRLGPREEWLCESAC